MEFYNRQLIHFLLLPFVIAVLLINHAAYSWPNGAPVYACGTMAPGHFRVAQTTTSPFTATSSSANITSNSALSLTLNGTDTFKGFLIEAFDNSTGSRLSTSTFAGSDSQSKTLNCWGGKNNALTHTNRNAKTAVTLTWTPPSGFTGTVVFKTTFVKNYTTFWVKQSSTPVQIN